MLSLVTSAAPESISDSDLLAVDRLDQRIDAEFGHLRRELRHRGVFHSGGDGFRLAAAEVEADQDDVMIEVGVLDRLGGAGGGRTAGRVDRLELRVRRQDVLGDVDALLFGAVGGALADDVGVDALQAFQHAVDAVVEGGNARNAFEDAELVAVLEHRLEVAAGELAGLEVVGGGQRRLRSSSRGCCCP